MANEQGRAVCRLYALPDSATYQTGQRDNFSLSPSSSGRYSYFSNGGYADRRTLDYWISAYQFIKETHPTSFYVRLRLSDVSEFGWNEHTTREQALALELQYQTKKKAMFAALTIVSDDLSPGFTDLFSGNHNFLTRDFSLPDWATSGISGLVDSVKFVYHANGSATISVACVSWMSTLRDTHDFQRFSALSNILYQGVLLTGVYGIGPSILSGFRATILDLCYRAVEYPWGSAVAETGANADLNGIQIVAQEIADEAYINHIVVSEMGRWNVIIAVDNAADQTITANHAENEWAIVDGRGRVYDQLRRLADRAGMILTDRAGVVWIREPPTNVRRWDASDYIQAEIGYSKPSATSVVIDHSDYRRSWRGYWFDEAAITEWGDIQDTYQSVVPAPQNPIQDFNSNASQADRAVLRMLHQQAASILTRATDTRQAVVDLPWLNGLRWGHDWDLGDIVQLDGNIREGTFVIWSAAISGTGSHIQQKVGLGAAAEVLPSIVEVE